MDLSLLTEKQYDDILESYKAKSELTDTTLTQYLFADQKYLNLSGASFTLTDQTCINMLDIINKSSLTTLHLYNLRNITDTGYSLLFNNFRNITFLNIGRCRKMTHNSFQTLKNLGQLKVLVLNGNHFITDILMQENLPFWPNLTDLSCRCRKITDKTIFSISEHCLNLTTLDLGKCFGISSPNSLIQLSQKCKNINNLKLCSLPFINDLILEQIVSNLNLKSLDIISCTKLTQNGLIKCLPKLNNIEYFRLMQCSNDLILALSDNCKNLQNIYIPKNSDVEEYSICRLLDNCPNLINIFISQSEDLSNKTLEKILMRKDLQELHIDGLIQFVDEMTYEPFENLSYTLDKLKVLTIKERPEVITDTGITFIGKKCPNLKNLDIRHSDMLTSVGFSNISKYFNNLTLLNLKLTNVTNEDIN